MTSTKFGNERRSKQFFIDVSLFLVFQLKEKVKMPLIIINTK